LPRKKHKKNAVNDIYEKIFIFFTPTV